jgi:integrase
MGVKVKERADDPGAWWLYINHQGKRKAKRVGVGPKAKKVAELAALKIQARLALGDNSVLDEPKPVVPLADLPRLREALPEWISRQERASEIRPSTAKAYKCRLATWAYPHALQNGHLLGDLPVNQVTREMIGSVIWRVKDAGARLRSSKLFVTRCVVTSRPSSKPKCSQGPTQPVTCATSSAKALTARPVVM